MSYFSNISQAVLTTWKGMSLSLRYLFDARKKRKQEWLEDANYFEKAEGTFTVQYPKEEIPVPDHGRYQLHNEIDDCIVCDKCAKVCPVDCIDIEPVRSPEVYGKTSDGTPLRLHAAKFDIDMAKCCFCGLCTVVCPTECLTMTKDYDFSTTNILDHNFSFSKMNEEQIAEKKLEFENYQAAKAKAKQAPLPEISKESSISEDHSSTPKAAKPVMRTATKPVVKPVSKPIVKAAAKPKPVVKPKPIVKPVIKSGTEHESAQEVKKEPKPVMKPKVPGDATKKDKKPDVVAKTPKPKPIIKPRPKTVADESPVKKDTKEASDEIGKKKVLRPVIRPKAKPTTGNDEEPSGSDREMSKDTEQKETAKAAKPKPLRPKIPKKP